MNDQKIDLLSLTEMWLHPDEYVSLNESTPPSHVNSHVPRELGRGGGVAAIFKSSQLINPKPKLSYNSFECLVLSLPHQSRKYQQPIIFAVVYRAPGANSEFFYRIPRVFIKPSPKNRYKLMLSVTLIFMLTIIIIALAKHLFQF